MPASAKAVGPATRNAREEVKSSIWLTIGVLNVARGFFAAQSRCTTETIASCSCVRPGLHVAQCRDRKQSRRPHWPVGLLELPGEVRRRGDIAGAPDAGAAAFAMRDQHRLAQARLDRCGGVADMDHERAAADRSAVD